MFASPRRRRERLAKSQAALDRQTRLGEFINMQHEEGRELGEWARERLRRNGLSQLFYDVHEGGAR